MASKIDILRAVAGAVGARPPIDENQGGEFLNCVLPVWDSVVDDYLARHAWFWATQTRTITASVDTPPLPWLYSYPLPVDRLLLRDVTDSSGVPVDYEVREINAIYAMDAGPLKAVLNTRPNPGSWPAYFARCIQTTIEGYAWSGLRDDYERGRRLIEQVDPPHGAGLLQKAISIDKRQRPPRRHQAGSVFNAFRNTLSRRRDLDE